MEHRAYMKLVENLEAVLIKEQKNRHKFRKNVELPGLYTTENLPVPEWHLNELNAMFYAVQKEKPDVKFVDIRFAESSAYGHSDYTKKFALYCADLVRGR